MGDDTDDELFARYARTRDRRVRNEIVERHVGLAAHIARRFSARDRQDDDLRQVAMLGLVKAVDRFDPGYGASFSSFAGRTIEGELKRHFRDRSWIVHVPRSAKEMHLSARAASAELSQRLGRSPSVEEIAEHLGVERDEVVRGLEASAAFQVGSIDVGVDDDDPADHRRALGSVEVEYANVEDRTVVGELLDQLPEREREIVRMRFYDRLSQSEIADRVGMSQMHVSRLLRRSFEQMRDSMV
jgi:RNA polymerase sigma-B factor